MDKTIQIVVVVMVMMITALAVMTMFGSQLNPFVNATEGQQDDAQCMIEKSNFERACNCDDLGDTGNPVPSDFDSECEWTNEISGCREVCEE